ncbi:hypothetical protein [Sodalis sp.]
MSGVLINDTSSTAHKLADSSNGLPPWNSKHCIRQANNSPKRQCQ